MRIQLGLAFILLFIGSAAYSAEPQATEQELFEQLAREDALLFEASFKNCDAAYLEQVLVEDFEFYHDKGGLVAASRDQFVAINRENCERQRRGQNYRARREPVPGSFKVYAMNNFGAIQIGEHRFFKLEEGKPDQPTEIAKFTHLWKREGSRWKLARVLSYDHQPALKP